MAINTNNQVDSQGATSGRRSSIAGSPTANVLGTSSGVVQLYALTTGTTSTKLGFDAAQSLSVTAPTGRFSIPANSAYYVEGLLIAERADYSNSSAAGPVCFTISFMVHRASTLASIQLNEAAVITKRFGTDNINMTASAITVTADTATGAVDINVVGESAVTYRWSGRFTYVCSASS